jgi:hypothetical protein
MKIKEVYIYLVAMGKYDEVADLQRETVRGILTYSDEINHTKKRIEYMIMDCAEKLGFKPVLSGEYKGCFRKDGKYYICMLQEGYSQMCQRIINKKPAAQA